MKMFEGEELKLGERAKLANVKPGDKDNFCRDDMTLYRYEDEVISRKIYETTNNTIHNSSDEIKNVIKSDISKIDVIKKEKAKEVFNKVKPILKIYESIDEGINARISEYKKLYGESDNIRIALCRANPSWWLALFILGAIVEVVFLIIQAVLGGEGFNPIVLVYGGLLAVGSKLLGYGAAHFVEHEKKKSAGVSRVKPMSEIIFNMHAPIVIGIILILFVASTRAFGDEIDVRIFSYTVLLGLVVSYFEFKYIKVKKEKEDGILFTEAIQIKKATDRHKARLSESKLLEEIESIIQDILEREYNLTSAKKNNIIKT